MDISREQMISKLRGVGSSPNLLDDKFMVNIQNPKKSVIVEKPPSLSIQDRVDNVVNSKAWRAKDNAIKNLKKNKNFLFNFIIFSIFLVSLVSFLIYQRIQKKHSVQGLKTTTSSEKDSLQYSEI